MAPLPSWFLALALSSLALSSAFVPPVPSATKQSRMVVWASEGSDRREHVSQVAAVSVALFSLLVPGPKAATWADSTGRYSTKTTAKRRYIPRINKGVKAFQKLEEQLKTPQAKEAAVAFAKLVEDDTRLALSLFGASQKLGELPDPKSRALAKSVDDFVASANKLASVAGTPDAQTVYGQAKAALSTYLQSSELPPLGSPEYKE